MPEYTVRDMIDQVMHGQVRIPSFQRGFVWEPDNVAFFMDSIYKRYPFGSLLFWRTKVPLRTERALGPFDLPNRDPDYPIDYVLDGQQRITSIFGVFQTELAPAKDAPWTRIYFDYRAGANAQESQFVALDDSDVNPDRHFALRVLFDTVAYRRATKDFDDELAKKIDEMQAIFKEVRLPVQTISTEDRAAVAIVFERVNRSGVPLDTLQLLSAWTWSEEFALQESFDDLAGELKPFGFEDVGADKDLLLRCCAAVLKKDAAPTALVSLNGQVVRERFQEVLNGVKGAVDVLQANLSVYALENLPFTTIMVPLSVFFAVPGNQHANVTDAQRQAICRWFWRCCFSRRYSSGVLKNLKTDIDEMVRLRDGEPSRLGEFAASLSADLFTEDTFRVGNVNTKAFILMLAQEQPLSFVSCQPVSLRDVLRECNRNEFHHMFPKACLLEKDPHCQKHSCLANFCFMSRADNVRLGGLPPSQYRNKMPNDVTQILAHAICPEDLFYDDYDQFLSARATKLLQKAQELIQ